MNLFEKILYFLQKEMETPKPYGWFHLICIFLIIVSVIILFNLKNRYSEKQLKIVLFVYGFTAFILELLKQIVWSFNYDASTNIVTWDYQWYAAPFQLCTTPIFVSLICLFLKKNKFRDSLLSYIAYITILGSFMTVLLPDSCFTKTILVNIHTMWLHCGSLVLSVYLLIVGEVKVNKKSLINAFLVFIGFVFIAQSLNIIIYNSGILNGEDFNMFYISPYFTTHLPVYNFVQENFPYIIYFIFYIISIGLGSIVIYCFSYLIKYNTLKRRT